MELDRVLPVRGLIHSSSAAVVRISLTCSTGPIGRKARRPGWPRPRPPGTQYSDWISSPLAGLKSEPEMREAVGPGTRHADLGGAVDRVEAEDGCRSTVAGAAPKRSLRTASGAAVSRRLTHT